MRLVASEAMTNSVLHAYRGEAGSIYLNAAVVSGELWVLIADDGGGLKPRADRPGLGLGLGLMSQVSDDFTIASRASGGTEVRIRFSLAPARLYQHNVSIIDFQPSSVLWVNLNIQLGISLIE